MLKKVYIVVVEELIILFPNNILVSPHTVNLRAERRLKVKNVLNKNYEIGGCKDYVPIADVFQVVKDHCPWTTSFSIGKVTHTQFPIER